MSSSGMSSGLYSYDDWLVDDPTIGTTAMPMEPNIPAPDRAPPQPHSSRRTANPVRAPARSGHVPPRAVGAASAPTPTAATAARARAASTTAASCSPVPASTTAAERPAEPSAEREADRPAHAAARPAHAA